jgi:predicted alpha/beta-fold hydrolase
MRPFLPLFTNPHVQTIAGHLWPRDGGERRFPLQARRYCTEPEVQVLVQTQQPRGSARGSVVMVHGLEGSGEAGYIRSLAGAAVHQGFAAHRFHMRTCGGTENLCPTLYHAGMTSDLLAVVKELAEPVVLVGFSLGGNVVLKLAGELGDSARRWIRAVCAISTPLDLAACAARIGQPDNRPYERRFVRRMGARLRATGRYRPEEYEALRSVFDIDDRITAPSFGFGNAANYYATQSSRQYLTSIRVPAFLLQAKDDTFIPFRIYEGLPENPCIRLVVTEHGGHLGFIARGRQRFWLDETVMEWIRFVVP